MLNFKCFRTHKSYLLNHNGKRGSKCFFVKNKCNWWWKHNDNFHEWCNVNCINIFYAKDGTSVITQISFTCKTAIANDSHGEAWSLRRGSDSSRCEQPTNHGHGSYITIVRHQSRYGRCKQEQGVKGGVNLGRGRSGLKVNRDNRITNKKIRIFCTVERPIIIMFTCRPYIMYERVRGSAIFKKRR